MNLNILYTRTDGTIVVKSADITDWEHVQEILKLKQLEPYKAKDIIINPPPPNIYEHHPCQGCNQYYRILKGENVICNCVIPHMNTIKY